MKFIKYNQDIKYSIFINTNTNAKKIHPQFINKYIKIKIIHSFICPINE